MLASRNELNSGNQAAIVSAFNARLQGAMSCGAGDVVRVDKTWC